MSKESNKNTNEVNLPGAMGRGPGRPGGFGGPRGMMPVQKPKDFRKTIKRLWKYFGRERKLLAVIFILILIDTTIGLAAPYLIGQSIDAMSLGRGKVDFDLLTIMVLVLGAAYVTDAVVNFSQGWLMAGVSQRIISGLRKTLFSKLQKLNIAFFDTHPHGEIMSRLTNDIENVSSTVSQSATQLMNGAITITGSLIMMLLLSPVLTVASLITVPLVFLLTRTIAKRTKVLFKEQQIELGRLNSLIEESISGIQVVKSFNHEDRMIMDFDEINNKLSKVGKKALVWSGYLMPLMNVINNLGFTVVAAVGGALAVKGLVTVGTIAMFLSYSRQFARPLNDLANIFNTLQSAVAGAERVFDVLDEEEESEDRLDAIELRQPRGKVVFKDVSFGYRPGVEILKNVNLQAEQGSTIALVGPTGAGKTTIVNLLARFYDVTKGKIFIDDKDIREYTRDSLRRCFGIVLQDTYLFTGTIRDNILYGKLNASQEEVKAASVMANADPFIRRLPNGYDTMLTEGGGNLSQGQRQLVAIARAILCDPSILILDEATSSVDTRTELRIQQAMLKLMKGRTSFIIAHRLSTIRDADCIMVIDKGRILEMGSHQTLINAKGVYEKMYYSQFKNVDELG